MALVASTLLMGCTTSKPDAAPERDVQLTEIAERLVDAGYTAATAARTDPDGPHHTATAGYGGREAETSVPENGQVRVGSASKTFTAMVIL